jgi:hypothetical protein
VGASGHVGRDGFLEEAERADGWRERTEISLIVLERAFYEVFRSLAGPELEP